VRAPGRSVSRRSRALAARAIHGSASAIAAASTSITSGQMPQRKRVGSKGQSMTTPTYAPSVRNMTGARRAMRHAPSASTTAPATSAIGSDQGVRGTRMASTVMRAPLCTLPAAVLTRNAGPCAATPRDSQPV
jgi:hypothetical protein